MSKPSGQCCKDYEKSRWARCGTCGQQAQIMLVLGLCQTCSLGETCDPTVAWKIHSVDCYKLRNRK